MEFKKIRDIKECRKLWDKFSPKESVWDIWEMAYSFHKGYDAEPLFILGIEGGKEIGILHLEKGIEEGEAFFDFFGGDYQERVRFYIKDKRLVNKFLAQAPDDTFLTYIDPSEKDFVDGIEEDQPAYSLDLERFDYNLDSYFSSFNKKHRKNLRYDLRQLEKLDYKLVWNVKEHLSRISELNILRFKEESNFNDPKFSKSFKLLIDAAEKLGILYMLSIKIGKNIEASQIALFYNNIYYVLTGGSNSGIKNLGKLLIIEHIKNAIRLKAKKIDFMSTESGWKKLWNLDETMLYRFDK